MRRWRYALSGTLLLSGCGGDAASIAIMGIVTLLTGWSISAGLRSGDGKTNEKEVDGASALLPRFQTPAWLEESRALLRVFGAEQTAMAANETTLQGLPFPVGYVVDISELVVRFNDMCIDGVEHSKEELYELALTNLRECSPSLVLPKSGVEALRDEKGHAAARALLIPNLLGEGDAVCVAAPSRELLLVFADGDDDAARNAHVQFQESAGEDPPIPKPVRVTTKGFELSRWPK